MPRGTRCGVHGVMICAGCSFSVHDQRVEHRWPSLRDQFAGAAFGRPPRRWSPISAMAILRAAVKSAVRTSNNK